MDNYNTNELICQEKKRKNEILTEVVNDHVVTSSRTISEIFEKEHRHVLRDIRTLIEKTAKLGVCNDFGHTPMFQETTVINEQNGQPYPEYLINRDGFTLLVMGFTGQAAFEWKLKYIDAFNRMEAKLREASAVPVVDVRMNLARLISRTPANRIDAIKDLYPEYFAAVPLPDTLEYQCDVNSSYRYWIEDCGITSEWIGDFPTTDIYYNYVRYCTEKRSPMMGKKTFYRTLSDDFNMTAHQKADGRRYFVGA